VKRADVARVAQVDGRTVRTVRLHMFLEAPEVRVLLSALGAHVTLTVRVSQQVYLLHNGNSAPTAYEINRCNHHTMKRHTHLLGAISQRRPVKRGRGVSAKVDHLGRPQVYLLHSKNGAPTPYDINRCTFTQ